MIKSYNPNNSISSPDKLDEDRSNENSLRPSGFSEFTGQQDIIENLKVTKDKSRFFRVGSSPGSARASLPVLLAISSYFSTGLGASR